MIFRGLMQHIDTKYVLTRILYPFVSLFISLVISGIILAACGHNPFFAFGAIFKGSFGSGQAFLQTLIHATPLIFSGLAFNFAMRAGLFNLGMEGQLYCGAMVAAVVGSLNLNLPSGLYTLIALLAGCLAGGLFAALAGVIKAYFGANEVISTLMLNFLALNITSYLVNYPLKAEGPVPQTNTVSSAALLPKLFPRSQLSTSILIALGVVLFVFLFMRLTVKGYEIQVVGNNPKAAQTAGVSIEAVVMLAMFISGVVAGLGGACHVLGTDRRFVDGFSPGYGFDGIAVAALAANNPLAIPLSALVFGALRSGALMLNMTTNIPTDFISVIQALVVVLVAAPRLIDELGRLGHFASKKEGKRHGQSVLKS